MGSDKPYYLGYCPIENNNTMLICIVEKSVVDNVLKDYQKTIVFKQYSWQVLYFCFLPDYSTVFPDAVLLSKKLNMKKEIMRFRCRQ